MKIISILPEKIREYMKTPITGPRDVEKMCDWHGDNNRGMTVMLESGKKITNLTPGEVYEIGGERFAVKFEYPRLLDVPGLDNVRDLGDGRIPFGKLFRGPSLANIDEATVDVMKNRLGIKTELDVSGGEHNELATNSFNQVSVGAMWYQHIFQKPETYKDYAAVMRTFTDPKNFPIYFHCTLGRDRTGCVAMFLKALAGATCDDLAHEQFLTFFSRRGDAENAGIDAHWGNFAIFIDLLMQVKGKEFSIEENAVEFLKTIGLTSSEINRIKENITH